MKSSSSIGLAVHHDPALLVAALDGVAGDADHPLHQVAAGRVEADLGQPARQQRHRLRGLQAVEPAARVVEDDDVAALRPAAAPVRRLLHQDPVVDDEPGLHRLRGDVEGLHEERLHDQREDDREGQQEHGLAERLERRLLLGSDSARVLVRAGHAADPTYRPTNPAYVPAHGGVAVAESYASGEPEPAAARADDRGELRGHRGRPSPDREALVEFATGRRWTWAELTADVDALGRSAWSDRGDRQGRPGRHLGAQLRRVDDRRSTPPPRSARSWSTSTRPTAPTSSPTRCDQSGHEAADLGRASSRPATTARWSRRCATTSDARAGLVPRHPRVDRPQRPATPASTLAELMTWSLSPDDPINIQYTSGTTGYPKGATLSHRNILNNGYFTTELINFTHEDRLCIPVPFYHCFGMVMGNLGCTTHGATMVIPAPGFDPETTLRAIADERCTGGVRRTDDVHRDAEPPDLRRPRPVVAAHRDHGRLDLPGRGDEALRQRHAHARGRHRLRHDRDRRRSPARPASTTTSSGVPRRSAGSTRTSRSRSSTRPPARPSSAASPASSAPAATR